MPNDNGNTPNPSEAREIATALLTIASQMSRHPGKATLRKAAAFLTRPTGTPPTTERQGDSLVAWMIELFEDGMPPRWFNGFYEVGGVGRFTADGWAIAWSTESTNAVHFTDKESARKMRLCISLAAKLSMKTDAAMLVTEHEWVKP